MKHDPDSIEAIKARYSENGARNLAVKAYADEIKRGPGRPPLGADKRHKRAVRFKDADWARIIAAAAAEGLSASAWAERAALAALGA